MHFISEEIKTQADKWCAQLWGGEAGIWAQAGWPYGPRGLNHARSLQSNAIVWSDK